MASAKDLAKQSALQKLQTRFNQVVQGKNYQSPDVLSDKTKLLARRANVGTVDAPRLRVNVQNLQEPLKQRIVRPEAQKIPVNRFNQLLATRGGQNAVQATMGFSRGATAFARLLPPVNALVNKAESVTPEAKTLDQKIARLGGTFAGAVPNVIGLGLNPITSVTSSGLGSVLGGGIAALTDGDVGEGIYQGAVRGAEDSPTYALTSKVVGTLANSINFLKPLADSGIAKPTGGTIGKITTEAGKNLFQRIARATLIETPYESVFYGIRDKEEGETLINNITEEWWRNLVFNNFFAGVNTAQDLLSKESKQAIAQALENSPTYKQTLGNDKGFIAFRGDFNSPKVEGGSAGPGKYYSLSKDILKQEGVENIKASDIDFKNPLEIKDSKESFEIEKLVADSPYKSLTEWAASKGHDGVIIKDLDQAIDIRGLGGNDPLEALKTEAKKYKSAGEFRKAFMMRSEPNALYHSTTKPAEILRSGTLRASTPIMEGGEPTVSFSRTRNTPIMGDPEFTKLVFDKSEITQDFGKPKPFGDELVKEAEERVAANIPIKYIKRIEVTPRGMNKNQVTEIEGLAREMGIPIVRTDQLTDIWNQAQATKGVEGRLKNQYPQGDIRELLGKTGGDAPDAKIPKGQKYRGVTETIKESPLSSEPLRQSVNATYSPKSNKITVESAKQTITYSPTEARVKVLGEEVNAENTAMAVELIKMHDVKGEHDLATQIAEQLGAKLTNAGQATQAMALYNKLSPDGILFYARKLTDNKIPGDVLTEVRNQAKEIKKLPTDSVQQRMAIHDMLETIARYAPQSNLDRALSFWKAGLLTAPTTSAGNLVGNTGRGTGEKMANIPATWIDMAVSLFTGERSRAVTLRGIKEGLEEGGTKGVQYFKTGFDSRRDPLDKFDIKRVNFGEGRLGKIAEGYVNGVFRLMGAQDQPFYYAAFRNSIAEQAKVASINQGLKGQDAMDFRVKFENEPPANVLKIADDEARLAVFQNETLIGEMGNKLAGIQNPIGRFLVNFVAPFRGVPSAVATAVTEWSPIGYARAAKTLVDGFTSGKLNQRDFTQELSKAGLGTFGLMGLGSFLYGKDLLTLDYPTEENERKLWEVENRQPFSVLIAGKWRSLNYVQPFATMLAAGGEMKRALAEGESLDTAFYRSMAMTGKAITEQSFLRGVSGAIGLLQDPQRRAEQFVEQTTGSLIPNFISKSANVFDPYEREVEGPLQAIQSDVPFLRNSLTAKRDMFGRKIENTVGPQEIGDPFRSQEVRGQDDALLIEIRRLQDAGYGVTPPRIKDKETFPGSGEVRLTQQQKDMLEEMIGTEVEARWREYVSSPIYQGLTDEQKEKELRNLSSDVRAAMKVRFMEQAKVGDYDAALASMSKNELRIYRGGQTTGDKAIIGIDPATAYTYGISDLGEAPSGAVEYAKWRKEAYSVALEVFRDSEDLGLTDEEKAAVFEQLDILPENVDYYDIASETNDIKTIFAREALAGSTTREQILTTLVSMRKEVNGEVILAPGVIDDLVDEGVITKAEGTALKNVTLNENGEVARAKMTGRGKSAKLKRFTLTKPTKLQIKTKMPTIQPMKVATVPTGAINASGGIAVKIPTVQVKQPTLSKYQVRFDL